MKIAGFREAVKDWTAPISRAWKRSIFARSHICYFTSFSFVIWPSDIGDTLAHLDLDAHSFDAALHLACALSERGLAIAPLEMRSLVRDIVEKVVLAPIVSMFT